MAEKFSIRLKRDFNGHRKGTIFNDVEVACVNERYVYRRGSENYPISVVEEL